MTAKKSKPTTKVSDTKANVPAAVPAVNKTRHLHVARVAGKSEDRMYADLVTDGLVANASTAIRFMKQEHGDVSLTELVASLRDQGEAVNRGDLAAAERMLGAQAVALNALFSEMARRAALNMGEHLGATESYMRLALKAQSQSRATWETLAAIKNPPVVYARQANINNGGQQQVNNGAQPLSRAPAANSEIEPTELLEAIDEQRLDGRAPEASGSAHPELEAMGAVDRPTHRRR
jgi:urease accessory protein UreF